MLIRIVSFHGETPAIVEKLKTAGYYIGQEFHVIEDHGSIAFGWPDVGVIIGRIFREGLNVMLQRTTASGEPIAILWVDEHRFQQR